MSSLINNRFLAQQYRQEGELLVYQGVDKATNAPIEIIRPSKRAQMRHGGTEFFLETQRNAGCNPSEQKPIWVGQDDSGPIAVYEESLTPYQNIDLTPEGVMHILGWIVPSLLINAQSYTEGLRPADLWIDKDGQLWLRPSGIKPRDSISELDPYKTNGSPLEQAIYGLGLILYESLTEKIRFSKQSALEHFQSSPPSLRSQRPELPNTLVDILDSMIDPIAQSRTAVASQISSRSAPPTLSTPEKVELLDDIIPTNLVVQKTASNPLVKEDIPLPPYILILKSTALPDAIRRNASALANIDDETLRLNMRKNKPLPLAGQTHEAKAEEISLLFKEHGISTEIISTKRKVFLPILSLLISLACFSVWLLSYGAELQYFFLAGLFLAGLSLFQMFKMGNHKNIQNAWNELHVRTSRSEHYQKSEALLQNARAHILRSDLPQMALLELLQSINDLQNGLSLKMSSGADLTPQEFNQITEACDELLNSAKSFSLEEPLKIEEVKRRAQRITALSQNINI